MFKSLFRAAKTLVNNSTTKVVRNKNGSTSTFTKYKSKGKTKLVKSGGSNWKGSSSRRKKR